MTGRHSLRKPGEWYCADCRAMHTGRCPCCEPPEDSEPAWLRAFWSVLDKLTRKSAGT